MPRSLPALAVLLSQLVPGASRADEPPPKRPSRVIEGRVLDEHGKPPGPGKVMFAPQVPPRPFAEASTATIDAEGHYRIGLPPFPVEPDGPPGDGPLRFLALSPGFRPAVGTVGAGAGPSTVDIRLAPVAWKSTDLFLVDREGKPVPGAEVALEVGGPGNTWERLEGDAEGRCRVAMAPSQAFGITIRREGYLAAALGLRGVADDPARLKIPLFAPIRGRVVDLGRSADPGPPGRPDDRPGFLGG